MANGIGAFLRGLSAAAPAFAGGLQGFQQGQELQRQRTVKEQEREQERQRMALERSLTEARIEDLLSQAEERRQPAAPEEPFGVSVGGVTTRARTPEEALRLRQRFALPEEPEEPGRPNLQRFNVPGRGEFTFNPATGEVTPITVGGEPLRAAEGAGGEQPVAVRQAVADNRRRSTVIENALSLLEEQPESVGIPFLAPDIITQRMDPEGVALRAAIADIGSLEIHDRSGAAVTISEAPRLRPFIPSVGDTPEAIRTKLQRLREGIEQETRLLMEGGGALPSPSAGAPSVPTPDVPIAAPAATDTGPAAPAAPQNQLSEARSIVQGMAPAAARAALEQAGFSEAEIAQIVGS